ncbi:MFS transporter [Streptococcus merionis]|uniref:MFS transporter n=1 Tax=Streptococcus merionis TaxID=400065 RepID=UPI003515A1B8
MKRLLSNKLYMTLFAMDLLSNFGDVLYYLALMNYVLLLPEAKFAIAMVSLSETIPILAGFVTGHFADQTKHKVNTIMLTLVFRAGLYLMLAFVMGFNPALWIVLVGISVNFLSDIAGQYENGLYYPISLRLVDDDSRQLSMSFKQATTSGFNIAFQAIGAALVGVLSYSNLALVNAMTFAVPALVMFSLRQKLERLLLEKTVVRQKVVEVVDEKTTRSLVTDMWCTLKIALRELMAMSEVRPILISIPLLNGIFSGLTTLILLVIKVDPDFIFINPPTTLATMTSVMLIASILGNILSTVLVKDSKLVDFVAILTACACLMMIGLYCHLYLVVLIFAALGNFSAGMINPKFMAMLMNRLPEERIATISGGVFSYFQLGMLAMDALLSAMILIFPVQLILIIYVLISLGLLGYTGLMTKKERAYEMDL